MPNHNARGRRQAPRHAAVRTTAAAATIAAALTVLPSLGVAASAETDDPGAAAPTSPLAGAELISEPQNGTEAIRSLGEDAGVAAERNDMELGELVELLRDDPTAWVDQSGLVHFLDPTSPVDERVTSRERWADTTTPSVSTSTGAFSLHSRPGARLTILLDADGGAVRRTGWNAQYGAATSHPAWDPSHDGAGFNDAEQAGVREIWASVAEDFAPFDVDVTTQDPGADALVDSGDGDRRWGARVLITPSPDAWTQICNRTCGGAAYRDVFRSRSSAPAWVFTDGVSNSTKRIAEAASHEAGHTLGLQHDGDDRSKDYSVGRDGWAPIMGAGYYQPVTQWSRGEYAGATNGEDDLGIIGRHLRRRGDESSPDTPARLDGRTGYITASDDVDAVLLGRCAAGAVVRVEPAALAPNLDVRATLVDAHGTVVAVSDPPSWAVSVARAGGMGAVLTVPTTTDDWRVLVRGSGRGVTYPAYASLGAYDVRAPGCDGAPSATPGRVAQPRLSVSGRRLSVRWRAPAGSAPVTAYRVSMSGAPARTVPAGTRSLRFRGVSRGRHTVCVAARNTAGTGRPSPLAAVRVH